MSNDDIYCDISLISFVELQCVVADIHVKQDLMKQNSIEWCGQLHLPNFQI